MERRSRNCIHKNMTPEILFVACHNRGNQINNEDKVN